VAANSGSTDFINWSFGPNFEILEGLNVYANYQEGTSIDPYQAGPIGGEDNFSENEMWEVGIKTSLLDGKLFATLAYYEWEQTSFDALQGFAESLEGEGLEFEFTWLATENLTFIGSYTNQKVYSNAGGYFQALPQGEEDWALNGGILNAAFVPREEGLEYPGSPQTVIKLFAIYEFDNGFYVSGGPIWQEEFDLSLDGNIELPDALVWNLNLGYKGDKWEAGLSIENLTNEDYFLGADPTFAANTLVTKAPETTYTFSVKYKF
jgi:outer membrane receptor protein involved in Fe transport